MSVVETQGYAPAGPPGLITRSLHALGDALGREAPELLPRLQDLIAPDGSAGGADGPPRAAAGELFPEIDYDLHPYYQDFAGADETLRRMAAERFFEAFSGLVRAEQALAARAAKAGRNQRPADAPSSQALEDLQTKGLHRFRLSPSELDEILARSQSASEALEVRRTALSANERGVEGVLQFLAERSAMNEDFEYYDALLQGRGIYDLIEQYYGSPAKLLAVNLQINSGDDTGISKACSFPDGRRAPIYYMHLDSAVGLLKILMYRSEKVSAQNGAFRYVMGSQRVLDPVQRAIRKACDKAGFDNLTDDARQLFMGLPPCLRRKANFGNDLLPETGADADALVARETILDGEAGDGFLADINGVHRGNMHSDPAGRREMFKFVLKVAK